MFLWWVWKRLFFVVDGLVSLWSCNRCRAVQLVGASAAYVQLHQMCEGKVCNNVLNFSLVMQMHVLHVIVFPSDSWRGFAFIFFYKAWWRGTAITYSSRVMKPGTSSLLKLKELPLRTLTLFSNSSRDTSLLSIILTPTQDSSLAAPQTWPYAESHVNECQSQ